MRNTIFFIIAFFASSLAFAQADASKLDISVSKGKLTLNKVPISDEWRVSPLVNLIGEADRVKAGYNRTHSYDKLGIVLFEKQRDDNPTDSLSEIQFYISEMEKNSVSPENFYTGNFKIENVKITKNIRIDDLRKKLKGYTESESYIPHNYRLASKGIYFYFQFDDTDSRLEKISIGPDRR